MRTFTHKFNINDAMKPRFGFSLVHTVICPRAGAMLLVGVFALWPCAAYSASLVNKYCPVTTEEKIDSTVSIEYNGKEIGFCCKKCRRLFLANPDKYLPGLALVSEGVPKDGNEAGDLTNGMHSVETSGVVIVDSAGLETGQLVDQSDQRHDHATDHENATGVVEFLGKFHPVVIHFPIALVVIAALFMWIRVVLGIAGYEQMAAIIMYWAAPSAVVATVLGFAGALDAGFPSFMADYFQWHRSLGLVSAAVTSITACSGYVWRRSGSRKAQITFRILVSVNALIVGVTGHLGSTLVYGPDHFTS